MRLILGLLALASLGTSADEPGWSITGYNALRGEHYGASGDLAAAPYAQLGDQFYDEFSLDLRRRVSLYESWQGSFSGVANASDYRSNERGGVLERARLVWEKGDVGVPYRLEAGDFQAGLSPRVIQRALKGVQLELQPGAPGRHSVQFFSGLATPLYRNMNDDREQSSGLSWLLEDAALGGFSLSAVHTAREAATTLPEYRQDTWGLGWGRVFHLGGHEIEAEAEWAHFSGEHAATGSVRNDRGDGLFAQVVGSAKPFDYRLRHAQYDYGFRPLGGAVAPDQRADEAYLGWRSERGVQVRGRLLDISDNRAGGNPLATHTLGVSLAGVPLGGVSTWLDLSQQQRDDRAHTVDGVSRVLSLALGKALSPSLNLRGTLQWNGSKDLLAGSHAISRQAQIALDRSFVVSGWNGSVSPGVLIRRSTGNSDQTDYNPTLRLALRRDRHDFSAAYSHYQQDAHFTGGSDSLIRQATLNCAWTGKAHRFDLEASHYDRDPTPGATTAAYRLAATWTWHFDRPARVAGSGGAREIAVEGGLPRLDELLPGGELEAARQRLRQEGGLRAPNRDIYEVALLDGLSLRQRLFLEHDGTHLDKSALLLDFPPGASPSEMANTYQRVAEALYKQLGTPERRVEEGGFSANLVADLMRGSFKRWIEWRTASGVLRLGIPSRADGPPRIEIIHARGFPAGMRWGVDLAD